MTEKVTQLKQRKDEEIAQQLRDLLRGSVMQNISVGDILEGKGAIERFKEMDDWLDQFIPKDD